MYMSRITLRPDSRVRKMANIMAGDGYAAHRALWRIFPGDSGSRREFLFRLDHGSPTLRFIIVSRVAPVDSEGAWKVETKQYEPRLKEGELLAFSMRVNPVRSARDANGRQKRHDVVMDAKKSLKDSGAPRGEWPPLSSIVEDVVRQWISERSRKLGFALEGLRSVGYRRMEFVKRGSEKVTIGLADIDGIMRVYDTKALVETLYSGFGPGKGFGAGLLLVRRI